MNEKQPFEQRISDKLQRLPLPDSESSWQQMKVLLDDKMPRSGGFNPYGRWWWTAMIAVVITAIIWLAHEQYKSADETSLAKKEVTVSPNGDSKLTKDGAEVKNELTVSPSPAVKPGKAIKNNSDKNQSINQESVKALNDNTSTLNTTEKNKSIGSTSVNEKEKNITASANKENDISNAQAIVDNNKNNLSSTRIGESSGDITNKKGNNKKTNGNDISADKGGNANDGLLVVPGAFAAANNSRKNNSIATSKQGNSEKNYAGNKTGKEGQKSEVIIETSGSSVLQSNQQHSMSHRSPETMLAENEMLINADAAINEDLAKNTSGSVHMSPAVLKKASITAAIVNDKSRSKRSGEGFSLGKLIKSINLPYEGENWWAAGLALNSGVATGSQNRVNYNVNAKPGVALDYIPSPYLQYHVNSNLYMQTEFNFSAPQYTEQFLVAQKTTAIPTTNDKLLQSTYVQKLYYFNWPLSLYYSPVRNLFFNAGIQFSSLQSGLKQVEERKITGSAPSPSDPLYSSEVLKFKDDTIAARLTPNEWRWETGANYYISRFTIGVKYNNSFSDLVKVQPAPGVPVAATRNTTFLLFLRYNLWESRKKDADKNYTSSLFK